MLMIITADLEVYISIKHKYRETRNKAVEFEKVVPNFLQTPAAYCLPLLLHRNRLTDGLLCRKLNIIDFQHTNNLNSIYLLNDSILIQQTFFSSSFLFLVFQAFSDIFPYFFLLLFLFL